jgi:hypothetical protein
MTEVMATRSKDGIGATRPGSTRFKREKTDWDPIRELHQGQRLREPHQQAGHIYGRPHPVRDNSKILSPSIDCLQSSIRSRSTLMGSVELHPNI